MARSRVLNSIIILVWGGEEEALVEALLEGVVVEHLCSKSKVSI
jgi:hypothetical protein